jgi:hypothetical protein
METNCTAPSFARKEVERVRTCLFTQSGCFRAPPPLNTSLGEDILGFISIMNNMIM